MVLKSVESQEIELKLDNVIKQFGQVGATNGVTFSLTKGKMMALLGPSGCGKTTTLRLIAGFETVDDGAIQINGRLVSGRGIHVPPEKRRVGMVFQEYALFPHLSVEQNVAFGLHAYPGERSRRVAEVLDLVGLAGLRDRMPHELSGGQQQRVALARALAPEPALILLDEPFSNLDASLRVRVRAEVRAILKEATATAIFVTHDQEEALSLVDEVAVMLHGVVQQVGPPQQLYWRPVNREVAAFVGDANFLPGKAEGRTVSCELGVLNSLDLHHGPVDILIRPENLLVSPAPAGTAARVQDVLFFGHDQVVRIGYPSGLILNARTDSLSQHIVGQPVNAEVRGPVMIYSV